MLELLESESFRNSTMACGVLVAVISVLTARTIARKKQTADLLYAARSDQTLQEGFRLIIEYGNNSGKNIRSLATPEQRDSDDAKKIRYVLNHFENMSTCIRAGIYDEDMLKTNWYSLVEKTYDYTQPMIAEAKRIESKKTLLQEFESLAKRWKANPLKELNEKAWRMPTWFR